MDSISWRKSSRLVSAPVSPPTCSDAFLSRNIRPRDVTPDGNWVDDVNEPEGETFLQFDLQDPHQIDQLLDLDLRQQVPGKIVLAPLDVPNDLIPGLSPIESGLHDLWHSIDGLKVIHQVLETMYRPRPVCGNLDTKRSHRQSLHPNQRSSPLTNRGKSISICFIRSLYSATGRSPSQWGSWTLILLIWESFK
jgi:hypothetical protein